MGKKDGRHPTEREFAIKANVILSFLDAHSIAYRSSVASEKLDLPTVTDRAQRFTAYRGLRPANVAVCCTEDSTNSRDLRICADEKDLEPAAEKFELPVVADRAQRFTVFVLCVE